MKTLKDSLNESLNEALNIVKGKTLIDFLKWYTGNNNPIDNKSIMQNLWMDCIMDIDPDNDGYIYDEYTDMIKDFKKYQNNKIEIVNRIDWISFKLGEKTIFFHSRGKNYK